MKRRKMIEKEEEEEKEEAEKEEEDNHKDVDATGEGMKLEGVQKCHHYVAL